MAILVGDIGGTSSRFAFASDPADPANITGIQILPDAEHSGLGQAAEAYLRGTAIRPDFAVLAVAAPITGGVVTLTNRAWTFSAESLTAELGCPTVLINDFEAVACALPYIAPSDLRPLGAPALRAATKAALGPGTGLGVACLAREGTRWLPVPSEGGHSDLPCADAEEFALFSIIRAAAGRVSAEAILSGPGLAHLHAARAELLSFPNDPVKTPADITTHAVDGTDPQARATVQLFFRFLARFAGDVALMFAADGGVYLHGGVTQRLWPLLDPVAFRKEFEAKAPHDDWLRTIGVAYIAAPTPALIGCAAFGFNRFG